MSDGEPGPTVFLLPDPVGDPQSIYGAAFLYFERIVQSTDAWVSTPEAYDVFRLIGERKPSWAPTASHLAGLWRGHIEEASATRKLLQPLHQAFQTFKFIYAANDPVLEREASRLTSAGLDCRELAVAASPGSVATEFYRHVLLEAHLERGRNAESTFDYLAQLLDVEDLPAVVGRTYLARLTVIEEIAKTGNVLMLNNPHLMPFLKVPGPTSLDASEVIAWELFANTLSPRLDPLTDDTVDMTARLREEHPEEIRSLRKKCRIAAASFDPPEGLDELQTKAKAYVELQFEPEIRSILNLDRKTFRSFIEDMVTDEMAWMGVLGALSSVAGADPRVSGLATVATLAKVGAKATKSFIAHRHHLDGSDFALLYRLSKYPPLAD